VVVKACDAERAWVVMRECSEVLVTRRDKIFVYKHPTAKANAKTGDNRPK
jgi:hypothetical protein